VLLEIRARLSRANSISKGLRCQTTFVVQLGAKLDQFQSDMNQAGNIADGCGWLGLSE
jgi:hypothetical protein